MLDVRSQPQPFNVEISIINGTVVVKGDVLMRKSKSDFDLPNESNGSIASCEVLFLEAEDDNVSQQSSENIPSRDASGKKMKRKICMHENV